MSDLQVMFTVLVRFEVKLWSAIDSRLRAEYELPLGRLLPMQVILQRGPCRVLDIAEELGLTVGGASKLIDRIESTGHCVRRPHHQDRRSSTIELTTAGRHLTLRAAKSFDDELRIQLGPALVSALERSGQRPTPIRGGHSQRRINPDERNT